MHLALENKTFVSFCKSVLSVGKSGYLLIIYISDKVFVFEKNEALLILKSFFVILFSILVFGDRQASILNSIFFSYELTVKSPLICADRQ